MCIFRSENENHWYKTNYLLSCLPRLKIFIYVSLNGVRSLKTGFFVGTMAKRKVGD
jgi:hypothetical protein